MVPLILGALLAGSWVYCVLIVIAARRYLAVRPADSARAEPISILKPLAGADEGLEENLRSFFEQAYPTFEILFAVRDASDAALPIVEKLRTQFGNVPSQVIVTGAPPYPNAKVYSLDKMMRAAQHPLLVMSDSDIRVTSAMLKTVAAEFQHANIGVATCPYRAVPGKSFWSALEAIGMNTEFLSGILVARLIDGMKFAVGPTIVARRHVLEKIGGFDRLKDYLAEDFVMGQFAAELGYRVILSSYVIEHRIGSENLKSNFGHRLRWVRSTRRSRPLGYIGQLFTYPIPLALLLVSWKPSWWQLLVLTSLLRAVSAYAVAGWVLHDPLSRNRWWLIALQDVLSFVFWIAGFFGNTITWRGRKYYLRRDGRFEPAG